MTKNRSSIAALAIAVVIALAITWRSQSRNDEDAPTVAVTLPATLSADAQAGKGAFESSCSTCHGTNAAGTKRGPPLVHIIYEPSHHGDPAFYRAAQYGVRQHHWPFGNMPPVPGVNRSDVTLIIAYVRELQRANGID